MTNAQWQRGTEMVRAWDCDRDSRRKEWRVEKECEWVKQWSWVREIVREIWEMKVQEAWESWRVEEEIKSRVLWVENFIVSLSSLMSSVQFCVHEAGKLWQVMAYIWPKLWLERQFVRWKEERQLA